jgi:hypothetical protein
LEPYSESHPYAFSRKINEDFQSPERFIDIDFVADLPFAPYSSSIYPILAAPLVGAG